MDDVSPWQIGKTAAQSLRLEEDLGFAPINIWDVVRRRGCEVALHKFGKGKGDGLYLWRDGEALAIINASEGPAKQRFTAAHELGHHEMHRLEKKRLELVDLDIYDTKDKPFEQAANAFAACLLAPDEALRRELEGKQKSDLTPLDVAELMRKYGLSYDATINRIHNARLINARIRDRLKEEGQGQVGRLSAQAGFDDKTAFPTGEDYQREVARGALELYRDAVISVEVLADALGVSADEAKEVVAREGYERPEDPLYDEATVLSLLE